MKVRSRLGAACLAAGLVGAVSVAGQATSRSMVGVIPKPLHVASPLIAEQGAGRPTLTSVLDGLALEAGSVQTSQAPVAQPPLRLGVLALTALAERCAPATPARVVLALISVESGGRPLLISRNGREPVVYAAATREEAERKLQDLRADAATFDVGLMQLNSATLARMGVDPGEALDACRNVALGAQVFDRGYAAAFTSGRAAVPLLSAYSAYNTGDAQAGIRNGYADRASRSLRELGQGG